MSLFEDDTLDIVKAAKDKVICRYTLIDDINKYAEGNLYFNNEIFRFASGGAGKGYAERGHYKGYKILPETREAFCMFDFGWQVSLEPQFKTDRWGIAVHPNGNSKLTKGCFGLLFESLSENVKCHNLFRDYFDKTNILNVEVI